jgi:hypothetical protein
MFFFFKRKKVVLDCFTFNHAAYELFPIEKSVYHLPDWWKQLPSKIDKGNAGYDPTMKKCQGLKSFYQNGISIPLWSEFAVRWVSDEEKKQTHINWKFSDEISSAEVHSQSQRGTFLSEKKYQHLKILSPWAFKCKEDINWLFVQNFWALNNPEKFIILPGCIDFKYQHVTNINVMIPFEQLKNCHFSLECGSPLVSLFPLTERKVEIKNHLVSMEEFKKLLGFGKISFTGRYNTIRSIIEKKEQKKCPFGFGK